MMLDLGIVLPVARLVFVDVMDGYCLRVMVSRLKQKAFVAKRF
ncbi:MAG: hypothetical protein HMLIMOIP_001274 [Candidatus Nitrosomirales archaeon]|jgi:hypothetical protein